MPSTTNHPQCLLGGWCEVCCGLGGLGRVTEVSWCPDPSTELILGFCCRASPELRRHRSLVSIQLHPLGCLPCMGARAGSLGFTSKLCWVLEYIQNIPEGVAATSQPVLCDQNQLLLLGLLFWVLFQCCRFPAMPALIPVPHVATWPLPGPDNRWLVLAVQTSSHPFSASVWG